jgi:hypothetical protein
MVIGLLPKKSFKFVKIVKIIDNFFPISVKSSNLVFKSWTINVYKTEKFV